MASKKSPLHPSALRLRDIRQGKRIVKVNIYGYVKSEFVVVSEPFVARFLSSSINHSLMVLLRDMSGRVGEHFLGDMGVVPYSWGWNDSNFTIAASKKHLILPPIHDTRPFYDPFDDVESSWDLEYYSYPV